MRIFIAWLHDPLTGSWRKFSYRGEKSLLLCAPAGRGKFRKALVWNALSWAASLVVNDPKGEICAVSWQQRARMGHKVVVINPFNVLPGILPPPSSFNPMAGLDPDSDTFSADIGALAGAIILATGGDAHWTDSARNLLAGLIGFCLTRAAEYRDLVAVNEMLNLPQVDFLGVAATMSNSVIDFVRHAAAPFIIPEGQSPNKEVWSVLNTARTQMSAFMGAVGIQRTLSGSDFTWTDLKHDKVTVYIVMPEAEAKVYYRFTRLLFASAFKALLRPPRMPVLLLFDEFFTSLGGQTLDQIETAISLGRGYGVQLLIVAQSMGQVEKVFGRENAAAVLASCGIWQFMRPNDALTAKLISERSGLREVLSVSRSTNDGVSSSDQGGSVSCGSSESVSAQSVPLYRETDLFHLHDDAQIIFADGTGYPIEAWGMNYDDPASDVRLLAAANPYAPGYVPPSLSDLPVQRIQAR